jgi:Right handed beta helix region
MGVDEFVDTDDDGLSDCYEKFTLNTLSFSGTSNPDNDSLSMAMEYQGWVHPGLENPDGDGASDAVEFAYSTQPMALPLTSNLITSPTPPTDLAEEEIIYVDGSYDGEEFGTVDQPYNTIAEGILNAPDYDNGYVLVRAGIYEERITIDKNMKLFGEGMGKSIIDVENVEAAEENYAVGAGLGADKVELRGFTIKNGYGNDVPGGIAARLYQIGIYDCEISDNTTIDFDGGGVWCYANVVEIKDCYIHDNTVEKMYTGIDWCGGGLYIINRGLQGAVKVSNCKIEDNAAINGGGIYLSKGIITNSLIRNNEAEDWGGGIYCGQSNVFNCTILDNTGGDCAGVLATYSTVQNNIIWHVDGDDFNGNANTLSYNCIEDGDVGQGDNFNDDPSFAGDGYHLMVNSPCIDAGTGAVDGVPVDDLDGENREMNGDEVINVDVGCDEFVDDDGDMVPGYIEAQFDESFPISGDDDYWQTTDNTVIFVDGTNGNDGYDGLWPYVKDIGNNEGPKASIQAAINEASGSGAVDYVLVGAGTYYTNITMVSGIHLFGEGSEVTIINGGSAASEAEIQSCVYFNDISVMTALGGFTLTGGKGTAIYPIGSYHFISGGGVLAINSMSTIANCDIYDNHVVARVVDSKMSLGGSGGGVSIYWPEYTDSDYSIVTNCNIYHNSAEEHSGGIDIYGEVYSTISNCNIYNNTAGTFAGGIRSYSSRPVTIDNCDISYNKSIDADGLTGTGGGIWIHPWYKLDYKGKFSMSNCNIHHNGAAQGGGVDIHVGYTPLTGVWTPGIAEIYLCNIYDNNATESGGGVNIGTTGECPSFWGGPELVSILNNCNIYNNNAESGGGVAIDVAIEVIIDKNYIANNSATESGGGCEFIGLSNTIISNNAILGNTIGSDAKGSAVSIQDDRNGPNINRIINCTIVDNSGVAAAIYCKNVSYSAIKNCIIWNNGAEFEEVGDDGYTVTYCCVEGGFGGTGNSSTDPNLATDGYHLTSSSTSCIDAGTAADAPYYDIDGDSRPEDIVSVTNVDEGDDIGCDEYVAP